MTDIEQLEKKIASQKKIILNHIKKNAETEITKNKYKNALTKMCQKHSKYVQEVESLIVTSIKLEMLKVADNNNMSEFHKYAASLLEDLLFEVKKFEKQGEKQ